MILSYVILGANQSFFCAPLKTFQMGKNKQLTDTAVQIICGNKTVREAKKYGISKRDIIFDPLALTVSADNNAAKETLRAVRLIFEKLGAKTTLGVSNVSFGLPSRNIINSTFFTMVFFCF